MKIFISALKESVGFTAPIFTKLIIDQLNYMESHTELHKSHKKYGNYQWKFIYILNWSRSHCTDSHTTHARNFM